MKFCFHTLRLSVILLIAGLSMTAVSCGDDSEPAPATPVITSFTPGSALPGATVTITGKNFSAMAAGNGVTFNGVLATVISATETTLVVEVPEGSTTGPISVTVDGVTVTSTNTFTPLSTSITAFTPESGVAGTSVLISGTNFSATASENIVKFNGTPAEVTAATATTLTVTVPVEATDGKISVTIHGKTTTSAKDFVIPAPEITGTFPDIAAEGILVTISGANFSTVIENNIVAFNGVEATVTAASGTELTVSVPEGATTGAISVTVGPHTAETQDDFDVCSGSPELVISEVVVSNAEGASSYEVSFVITNVGSEDADVSKVSMQNYASADDAKGGDLAASGFGLSSAPVLAPGESYTTDVYNCNIVGGNTTSHPYLVITLNDVPDGSIPECDIDNNIVIVPFN